MQGVQFFAASRVDGFGFVFPAETPLRDFSNFRGGIEIAPEFIEGLIAPPFSSKR
jgi:hypothetical protein